MSPISPIKSLGGMALFIGMALGAACASDYYGYSEAQWRSLNEQQREAAIREYDYILEQKREREYKEEFIDPVKESVIKRGLDETPR